jgi:hypothetical protein
MHTRKDTSWDSDAPQVGCAYVLELIWTTFAVSLVRLCFACSRLMALYKLRNIDINYGSLKIRKRHRHKNMSVSKSFRTESHEIYSLLRCCSLDPTEFLGRFQGFGHCWEHRWNGLFGNTCTTVSDCSWISNTSSKLRFYSREHEEITRGKIRRIMGVEEHTHILAAQNYCCFCLSVGNRMQTSRPSAACFIQGTQQASNLRNGTSSIRFMILDRLHIFLSLPFRAFFSKSCL